MTSSANADSAYLTRAQAARLCPDPDSMDRGDALRSARRTMQATNQWSINQQMGRRWPIGCVALEITQRCNLDCTLCYLSENSEAVHDIPLTEIFRRIDAIADRYGPLTNVQITGGDPTLRRRDELQQIIARVAKLEMRSTLMTNGIKADRELLTRLASCGLTDVAFHVDSTQNRRGLTSERQLNALRLQYIETAERLGLNIMFNTTVHHGNIDELDDILGFFRDNARRLRLVSFQVQADTGRGIERHRPDHVAAKPVWQRIERFLGTSLNTHAIRPGHKECNRYGIAVVTGRRSVDLLDETMAVGTMLAELADTRFDRAHALRTVVNAGAALVRRPHTALGLLAWGLRKLRPLARDALAERALPTTLSFMVHSFMDACALDAERIEACAFKVMTRDGPLSMCLHNARRDEFILAPLEFRDARGARFWNPLSGNLEARRPHLEDISPGQLPAKRLKGRARRFG